MAHRINHRQISAPYVIVMPIAISRSQCTLPVHRMHYMHHMHHMHLVQFSDSPDQCLILHTDKEAACHSISGMTHRWPIEILTSYNTQVDAVNLVETGRACSIPQFHPDSTYDPIVKKSTAEINWNQTGLNIHNFIRGHDKSPGAWGWLEEQVREGILWELVVSAFEGRPSCCWH